MKNIFTKHPKSIGDSYFRHFLNAFSFGVKLLLIAVRVFIHGIFPFFFEHSASDRVSKLNDLLQQRKNVTDISEDN